MSRSPEDDFSDDFDESEEEDFHPKPKGEKYGSRPTKVTNHKRPPKNHEKVINLGSVGASSKKKPTKRPVSATDRSRSTTSTGHVARQLWQNALDMDEVSAGTVKKPNRSAVEYWGDSLRRTGVGLTTQSTSNSMSGLNKKQRKDMSYASTSHYLRQLAGTEKTKRAPAPETMTRSAPGTPMYKSPEEYYDEILDLKKQIGNLSQDNSQMKSKVRRLEEDNLKKEREIEQLLDPTKSEELRRTLADRKPDAGVVIHSLKQKILKLEHQLKDREAAHSRLQSELKTTKIDEMKLQVETFYKEIVRLNQLKTTDSHKKHHRDEPLKENNNAKLKALQDTILRMNEKSFRLTAENKSLKMDLEKTMEDLAKAKERQKKHRDHDDDRRSKHDRKGDRYDADTISLMSEIESRHGEVEGKITLEGSLAQRLDQLDRRETEQLEDADKQRKIIKQLKEDRGHYRKKAEEREKEIKSLKKEIDSLSAELEAVDQRRPTPRSSVTPRGVPLSNAAPETPRRGSRSGRGNRSRSPSLSSERGSRHDDRRQRELDEEDYRRARAQQESRVERFREKHAARTIQRGWRESRHTKRQRQEEKQALLKAFQEREAKVESFRTKSAACKIQGKWRVHRSEREAEEAWRRECEDRADALRKKRAASRIQNGWISHQSRKRDAELDDTTEFLQSAFRGHLSRRSQIDSYKNRPPSRGSSHYEDDETVTESELDSATEFIQSNIRGHATRREQLRKSRLEDSDSEMDEAISTVQSAFRGHLFRKNQLSNPGLRSTSRSPSASRRGSAHYRQRLDSAGEEEDEDDKHSYVSRGSRRSGRDSGVMLRKPPASPRKYSLSSKRDDNGDDSDDSDDDIIVTTGRR